MRPAAKAADDVGADGDQVGSDPRQARAFRVAADGVKMSAEPGRPEDEEASAAQREQGRDRIRHDAVTRSAAADLDPVEMIVTPSALTLRTVGEQAGIDAVESGGRLVHDQDADVWMRSALAVSTICSVGDRKGGRPQEVADQRRAAATAAGLVARDRVEDAETGRLDAGEVFSATERCGNRLSS